MSLLVEIPILEEIYDFDTFSLREISEKLSKQIQLFKATDSLSPLAVSWKKKAERFVDLAVFELKEREVIENFGDYCAKQTSELLLNTPFSPDKESETKETFPNEEKYQSSEIPSRILPANNISFHPPVSSSEISLPSISKHSMSSVIKDPRKRREEEMFRFMKETLAATRIGENRLVIGKSTVGKYVPPKKKKPKEKEKKLKRSKTEDYGFEVRGGKKKPLVLPKIGKSGETDGKKGEEAGKILMKKGKNEEKKEKNEGREQLVDNKKENEMIHQVEEKTVGSERKMKKDNLQEEIVDQNSMNGNKGVIDISLKKSLEKSGNEENQSREFKAEDALHDINHVKNQISSMKCVAKEEKPEVDEKNTSNIRNENSGSSQYDKEIELTSNIKAITIQDPPLKKTASELKYQKNPLEQYPINPSSLSKNRDNNFIEYKENADNEIIIPHENSSPEEPSEKIDFQAKYKVFIEKAKNFKPSSLYEINESESGESEGENGSAREDSSNINKMNQSNKNHEKLEKPLAQIENEITHEKLDTIIGDIPKPQIRTQYFSITERPKTREHTKPPTIQPSDLPKSEPNLGEQDKNSKNEAQSKGKSSKNGEVLKHSKKILEQTLSKYQKESKSAEIKPLNPNAIDENIEKIKKKKPEIPKIVPKPKVLQHKPLYDLDDSKIVDYSAFFPCFNAIFSGYHNNLNNLNNFDYIETMKEIYNLFAQHVTKVDDVDKLLAKHKVALAPLEMNPNELVLLNDPKSLSYYAYRTNIDVRSFIARQEIFERKMRGEQPEEASEKTLFYRVVKNREEVYDIVTKSFLRKLNWAELPHGMNLKTSWNLLWTWSKPQIDFNKLLYWQKVNHFPLNKNIVRKDLLKKNIEKTQKLGSKTHALYNFIPHTYVLPKEYCQFMDHFHHDMVLEGKENIWIMKPIGKSRGRGISLLNDMGGVVYAEQVIVQKYLKNPLLLRGFKFDLRIYVLVTSIQPLEAFIYKEGFARLSTEPFSLDPDDLNKLFIHLTNVAIQKNNVDFHRDPDTLFGGSKISLKNLKTKLEERGFSFSKIWTQVCEIVVKSLLACQQEIPNNPNCFELFGYDIIVDDNLKCWLLEVNSSPSLSRDTILDDIVKQQLIDDIVELVDPILFDRKKLLEVMERRIKEEHGLKSTINTQNNSKNQMNRDLTYILDGKVIRKVGEQPRLMGNFERLAPSEYCERIVKIIQQYKVGGNKNCNAAID